MSSFHDELVPFPPSILESHHTHSMDAKVFVLHHMNNHEVQFGSTYEMELTPAVKSVLSFVYRIYKGFVDEGYPENKLINIVKQPDER